MELKYLKDKLYNVLYFFYEKDKFFGWSGGWYLLFRFFLKLDIK